MRSTFFTFVNTVLIKKILILFQITTDYNLEKDCSECFALRNFQAKEQARSEVVNWLKTCLIKEILKVTIV